MSEVKRNLSKKNYNQLDENFLYKKEPIIDNSFNIVDTPGHYHCKNWSFTCKKLDDGRVFMLDTYFNSFNHHHIEVTDENSHKFEKIFDFREVHKVGDSQADEYREADLFCVATGSGGYSCGGLYWVKNGAEKDLQLQIDKQEKEIDYAKRDLAYKERELERLKRGKE